MIVALELPLKVATIILSCIFSLLFSDFRARGPISIYRPPIVALIEFFHADVVASVHSLSVSSCVLVCILCLCYDLSPMLSAPVVVLFYLKF